MAAVGRSSPTPFSGGCSHAFARLMFSTDGVNIFHNIGGRIYMNNVIGETTAWVLKFGVLDQETCLFLNIRFLISCKNFEVKIRIIS